MKKGFVPCWLTERKIFVDMRTSFKNQEAIVIIAFIQNREFEKSPDVRKRAPQVSIFISQ